MPVEVAATVGERFPEDSAAAKSAPAYKAESVTITLGGKAKHGVTIRTPFKPDKLVVDPNIRVLQLRRESAEATIK